MADPRIVARALANAYLDGPWLGAELLERAASVLGGTPDWLRRLTRQVGRHFVGAPSSEVLQRFLLDSEVLRLPYHQGQPPQIARWRFAEPPTISPRWGAPEIASLGDLGRWLKLEPSELDWFADTRGMNRGAKSPRLDHYHRAWIAKRSQGYRLVERPKLRLKQLQRRLLREILDCVPSHPAVHGFVRGCSPVTFAAAHQGQAVVLRLDLEDFFASVRFSRLVRVYATLGYRADVAKLLAGLCSTTLPLAEWRSRPGREAEIDVHALRRQRERLLRRHLPQGAPTSPALANLCAFRLDRRLDAAARSVGARYTRYADDLAFSGGTLFAQRAQRFVAFAAGIALDEGFTVNFHKTRVMPQSRRQQLAGLVVNQRAQTSRVSYDRLRAILTNCLQTGPSLQNRDGHSNWRGVLEGQVAWVAHTSPSRGAKLRSLLQRIEWDE